MISSEDKSFSFSDTYIFGKFINFSKRLELVS